MKKQLNDGDYPYLILLKDRGVLIAAYLNADRQLSALRVIDADNMAFRLGNFYDAKIKKRISSNQKNHAKAFVELDDHGVKQDAFLGNAANHPEGARLWVQIIREASHDKIPEISTRLKFSNRYADYWQDAHQGADQAAPLIEYDSSLGQGLAKAQLMDFFEQDQGWAQASSRLQQGKFILKKPIAALNPEQIIDALERLVMDAKAPQAMDHHNTQLESLFFPLSQDAKLFTDQLDINAMASKLIPLAAPDLTMNRFDYIGKKDPHGFKGLIYDAIEQLKSPLIPLEQGANLILESAAALTAIDINSGGLFHRDGAYMNINMNAAAIIMQQLKLRAIGGVILIDPLKPEKMKGNAAITLKPMVDLLRKLAKSDPVRTDILGVTKSGLIELVRQHTAQSLSDYLRKKP